MNFQKEKKKTFQNCFIMSWEKIGIKQETSELTKNQDTTRVNGKSESKIDKWNGGK